MVSQQLAPREERGSDSHSDYTHSSLADSNYSLISGDEAAILTDEEDDDNDDDHSRDDRSSSLDLPRSVASFDEDEDIAASRLDTSTNIHKDPDVDEVDESLIEQDDHGREDLEHSTDNLLHPMDSSLVTPTVGSLNLDASIAAATAQASSTSSVSDIPQAGHPFHLPSNGTFRLLFHGPNGAMKQSMISKIAQAISIYRQSSDHATPNGSTFSVVPISDFESADSTPEVELIPSNGLNFVVEHCTSCERCQTYSSKNVAPACTALERADLEAFLLPKQPLLGPLSAKSSLLSGWFTAMPSIQAIADPHVPSAGSNTLPPQPTWSSSLMLTDFLRLNPFVLNRHLAHLQHQAYLPCKAIEIQHRIDEASDKIKHFFSGPAKDWLKQANRNLRDLWLDFTRSFNRSFPYATILTVIVLPLVLTMMVSEYNNSFPEKDPEYIRSPLDRWLAQYNGGSEVPEVTSTSTKFAPTGLSEVLPAHYTYSGKPPREWSYKQPWKPETAPVRVYMQSEEGSVYLSILPALIAKGLTPVVLASSNDQPLSASLEQRNKTMFAVKVNANYKTQPVDLRIISALKTGTVDDLFQIRAKHKTSLMALGNVDFIPKRSDLSELVGKELMVLQRNARRIATKTSKQVDKRLKHLNKESKALMRLSAQGLAVQEERLMHLYRELRQEERKLRKRSNELTKQGKKMLRRWRKEKIEVLRAQILKDIERYRREADRHTHRLQQRAKYVVKQVSSHFDALEKWLAASSQPTTSPGSGNRRSSTSWYKSKALGKWRAFARRTVNHAAGRKVYTQGLEHDDGDRKK